MPYFLISSKPLPDESKYSLCSFRDTSLKTHIFHLGELIHIPHSLFSPEISPHSATNRKVYYAIASNTTYFWMVYPAYSQTLEENGVEQAVNSILCAWVSLASISIIRKSRIMPFPNSNISINATMPKLRGLQPCPSPPPPNSPLIPPFPACSPPPHPRPPLPVPPQKLPYLPLPTLPFSLQPTPLHSLTPFLSLPLSLT